MVNVEADVLAGPLLARKARDKGVVYSMAYGDQPALIAEQVDWARSSGFEVVAAGKGTKYLPAYHTVTPDGVWQHYGLTPEEAKKAGMNPQMFNSFLDGTKSALEMAAVANACGLEGAKGRPVVSAVRRRSPRRSAEGSRQRGPACRGRHGRGRLLARARRPSGVPRSPLGRLRRLQGAQRLRRRLLQAIWHDDRQKRPLCRALPALSPDRAGAVDLGPQCGAQPASRPGRPGHGAATWRRWPNAR